MTPAVLQERQDRWKKLSQKLRKLFPIGKTMLNYSNPWELVVAVILSAQCTDKRINSVTPALFKKYKKLNDYLHADIREFETYVNSVTFYHTKTRYILESARILRVKFNGTVPTTIEELIQLPGVGRKTANVVICNAYGKAEGIAVDTHVRRFAIRYDLTDSHNPLIIERDLMRIIPKKDWTNASYFMINYGREIAPARRYNTENDPLITVYPKAATRFRV